VFPEVCAYMRTVTSVANNFTDLEYTPEDVEVCPLYVHCLHTFMSSTKKIYLCL